MSQTTTGRTATEERAVKLLGQGIGTEAVATALGVSPSRISQLLAIPAIAEEVSELRFKNLQKHNERDATYDSLEDDLLKKLKAASPLLLRPMEITKVLQVINAAKRRGSSAPESIVNQNTLVNISLPVKVINKLTTNVNNQVISIGNQDLLTIQSSAVQALKDVKELSNDATREEGTMLQEAKRITG